MKKFRMYTITLLFVFCIFLNGMPTVAAESEIIADSSVEESSTASTDQSSSDNETINSSESVTPNFDTIPSSEDMLPQDNSDSNNNANVTEEINQDLEDALAAGFTKEQYEAITSMPRFEPVEDQSGLNRALLTDLQAKVVSKAKEQLGKPYVFGTQGPNTFDCGGLVRYVFKQAVGMDIPMGSPAQQVLGKAVSLNALQPGDLLFFVRNGETASYHVAIYIGNGQYIHSPQPGEYVKILNMSAFPPQFARRVLVGDSAPAQGNPITDGRYVTITGKGHTFWNSFNWDIKDTSNNLFGKTYQIKVRYQHQNGITYYSLYDSKGVWKGYVDSRAATIAPGKRGIWIENNEYVTLTKKDWSMWNDIESFGSVRNNTTSFYQQTMKATGRYNHFSGESYYSIADKDGKWLGYVNVKGVEVGKGKQGAWIENHEYVTLTKKDWSMWNDIDTFSSVRNKTTTFYQQTMKATGRYNHFSGESYYSINDKDGKWLGYVNVKGVEVGKGKQGAWIENHEYVTLTKKDWDMWNDIDTFSSVRNKTTTFYQQTMKATGRYNHYSGESYYSIFDKDGKWLGYINVKGVSVGEGKQGVLLPFKEEAIVTQEDYPFWEEIDEISQKRGNSSDHLGENVLIDGEYHHFSGKIYYSLYDSKGNWLGYIESEAISISNF